MQWEPCCLSQRAECVCAYVLVTVCVCGAGSSADMGEEMEIAPKLLKEKKFHFALPRFNFGRIDSIKSLQQPI